MIGMSHMDGLTKGLLDAAFMLGCFGRLHAFSVLGSFLNIYRSQCCYYSLKKSSLVNKDARLRNGCQRFYPKHCVFVFLLSFTSSVMGQWL